MVHREWKRERDALAARLATKPRHGLLPPLISFLALIVSWVAALYAAKSTIHANSDFIAGVHASQSRLYAADAAWSDHIVGLLTEAWSPLGVSLGLTIAAVQLPLSVLLYTVVYSPRIPIAALLVALAAAYKYAVAAVNTASPEAWTAAGWGLVHALLATVLLGFLSHANLKSTRQDEDDRKRIEDLMREIDKDGDGVCALRR